MWTNQPQTKAPSVSPAQGLESPADESAALRGSSPAANNLSRLGSTLKVRGTISGSEDLHVDGKVEGPIALRGKKLTVGHTGQLNSEITAREAVVQGVVAGNISVDDRVEIKKGSEVTGDITAARIGIEDGAYFKGRIEIDRGKLPGVADLGSIGAPIITEAN